MTESKPATSHDPYETDELARTAGRLVSSVEHEGNPKFRQSNFLDLMRRIRDKQAGIQGSNIVDNANGAVSVDGSQSSDKGKGKARDVPLDQRALSAEKQQAYSWANEMAARGASSQLPPSMQRALGRTTGVGGQNTSAAIPDALSYQQDMEGRQELNDLWAEEDARSEEIERQARERQRMAFVGDGGDAAAREREDDDAEAMLFNRYQGLQTGIPGANAERWTEANVTDDDSAEDFVGRAWRGTQGRGVNGAQAAEWDTLQRDWDAFEATATGMQPVGASGSTSTATSGAGYRFQTNNPYVSQTHHHAHHHAAQAQPSVFESVLEHEAAVQSDPSNAGKWFELGVKQQENEREGMAITALHQAVQLDPSFRDAWLALAVSYTNENDRTAAFGAIEHWIETSEQYRDIVRQHKAVAGDSSRAESTSSRHERLTELLIALARSAPAGEVDADVQIALGVLFNSSEDYDKAVDCFLSALSVRPDDWLLYNRLGATLSNSGRSNEALHYYHQALNLRPEFVRCHFNLSISCLNLKVRVCTCLPLSLFPISPLGRRTLSNSVPVPLVQMYQEAAEHIYTALNLQQVESTTNGNAGADEKQASLTSSSLWETFRVTLEL